MIKGHVAIRQCACCRSRRPQRELIRIRENGSKVFVDKTRASYTGRSVYSCPNEKCLEMALKKNRLERALRKPVSVIPSKDEILKGLENKG